MKLMALSMMLLMTALCSCAVGPEEGAEMKDAVDSPVTEKDKEYLVNLARQTLYWYLGDRAAPEPDAASLSEGVKLKLGCFVTLDKKGTGLRGCIGIFERREPLYKNVISRAIAAAVHDSRFPRVTYGELKDIKLEISVLTAPEPLQFDSADDLLAKLRPKVDGVILQTRWGNSTYLPQVWEQIPQKEMFLSHLCRKHGAPMDAWRDSKGLEVLTYQAIVFGEEVFGRKVVGRKGAVVGKGGAVVLGSADPAEPAVSGGGRRAEQGEELAPGTVVSPESDIGEKE